MPNYRSTKDWELKGVNPGAPWTLIANGTLPNPEDTKPQSVDDETRHPLVVYQAHTPTMAQVKCLGVKHTNDIRNRFGFCDLLSLCMELPYYVFICALPPNADADFKSFDPLQGFYELINTASHVASNILRSSNSDAKQGGYIMVITARSITLR